LIGRAVEHLVYKGLKETEGERERERWREMSNERRLQFAK